MSVKSGENNESGELDAVLSAARAGSSEARNELFARVRKYLDYIADQHYKSSLSAKAGISDIVQQTMLRAASDFEQFRGDSGDQFRGWLRQILVNEVRGMQRHYGAIRRNPAQEQPLGNLDSQSSDPSEPHANSPSPSGVAMAAEGASRLRKALESLPAQMRQVIHLRNWDRLQFHEIAERMNISLSQAAKLWYLALEELKRLNAESGDD